MSLRLRLVLATCLVALVALTVAGVATYAAFTRSQLDQIDDLLQRSHEPVERIVTSDDDDDQSRAIGVVAPGTLVELIAADGTVIESVPAREPGRPPLLADLSGVTFPLPPRVSNIEDQPTFRTLSALSSTTKLRVRLSRSVNGTTLVLGLPLHQAEDSRSQLVSIEIAVAGGALVLAALVGWIFVRIGLRPLRRAEQTALAIADGGALDSEVPGARDSTEVGRLAIAMNTMLARIRTAFAERDATEAELRAAQDRMQRFVADVSHELRTPLAAVSAYAELIERGARDRPDDLERSLRGISVESARMRKLVDELLLLARLDEGRALATAPVDLSELIFESISAARVLAPDRRVVVHVSSVVRVDGDAGRLRQVVDNVLANVRRHTPQATTTTIRLDARGGSAVLQVADDGPGMAPHDAARAFERFYRADPSRSRSSGGAGLGLAIVHDIVVAHRGETRLDTAPGRGLTVTITLPLAHEEPADYDAPVAYGAPVAAKED